MSDHTPGPWHVSEYGVITAESGTVLGDGWPVTPANARLIAAAPSMLAALQAVEFMLSIPLEYKQDLEESRARALSMARVAITKATGTD